MHAILIAILLSLAATAQPDPHAEDRKRLLDIFHEVEASINSQSLGQMVKQMDPNATVVWANGEVSRGPAEVLAYYDRMVKGKDRILTRYNTKAALHGHARFLGNGDVAVADGTMQGVTCVFLLHELPGEARQQVLQECFRVLEPGGVLVLADSVQLADSPEFDLVMENFRRVFHEPYYRDYIADAIDARLAAAGFTAISAETHLMTRVWSARKPV